MVEQSKTESSCDVTMGCRKYISSTASDAKDKMMPRYNALLSAPSPDGQHIHGVW